MSEPERPPSGPGDKQLGAPSLARLCFCAKGGKPQPPTAPVQPQDPSQGPSLTLIYGLLALALAAAIGFALLIVLPFYHRR